MTQFSIALMILSLALDGPGVPRVDGPAVPPSTHWTQFEDTKQVQVFEKFVPGPAMHLLRRSMCAVLG